MAWNPVAGPNHPAPVKGSPDRHAAATDPEPSGLEPPGLRQSQMGPSPIKCRLIIVKAT